MSLKQWTPCDEIGLDGRHHCPYAEDGCDVNCEYWCGAEEPEDTPEEYEGWHDEGWDDFMQEQEEAEYDRRMAEDEALWWSIREQVEREYPEADEQEVIDMTEFRWLKQTGQM